MAAFLVKALLAGSFLYFACSLGEASLSKVTSLTSSVVEQAVYAHVQKDVFGHGKQLARFKREVVTKTLPDAKGCLDECTRNESSQLMSSVLKNTARLVALALEDLEIDGKEKTPAEEAAFKKRIEDKTIANMGPMFEDMCRVYKNSNLCITRCPDSQARTILRLDNESTQTAVCEPSRNWKSFSEYWTALNCTNTTELEKPCENKCGPDQSIANATHLHVGPDDAEEADMDDDKKKASDGIVVKYESDSKKNTATANKVCKATSCQMDCYKPIITQKCGAKAFDLYYRMTKVGPHQTLAILKVLDAVGDASECKQFL